MSADVLTTINTRTTPQGTKAKPEQVFNSAGGAVFEVTPETRIRRFLILGTTGGTYYKGESELTRDNAKVLIDWATNNTKALVDIILEISLAGRAPKQNPTIFALAAAAGLGDAEGKRYALSALPSVARTGTHLFLFAQYIEQFRGWGRGLRNAVANWYENKESDKLAYQMVKYRQRNGWTHRDLLRLSHAVPTPIGFTEDFKPLPIYNADGLSHKALYDWATKGTLGKEIPDLVRGFILAQSVEHPDNWVSLIDKHGLSWEMLPDAALKESKVWEALISKGMPQMALIRQLPRLTNLGVLQGENLSKVRAQLTDQERLTKARIHPVNVLLAMRTYASGRSLMGSSSWNPNVKIVDALDEAFYKSFGNIEAANKRTLNALDVSGSMSNPISGLPISCREASAAMAMTTIATEPEVETIGFTGGSSGYGYGYYRNSNVTVAKDSLVTVLPLSGRQRLDDVVNTINGLPFGSTDCALPMLWALEQGKKFDTFVVWTDNETWAGKIHPFQALKKYRQETGIDARLIVVGMTATNFSIADPSDAGMLDVVGFDSAVPNLIADFSAGRI